ncbi:MAG: hypothetical protein QW416_02585 [Candidatus Nitrosocaldaceae archaeon]
MELKSKDSLINGMLDLIDLSLKKQIDRVRGRRFFIDINCSKNVILLEYLL